MYTKYTIHTGRTQIRTDTRPELIIIKRTCGHHVPPPLRVFGTRKYSLLSARPSMRSDEAEDGRGAPEDYYSAVHIVLTLSWLRTREKINVFNITLVYYIIPRFYYSCWRIFQ